MIYGNVRTGNFNVVHNILTEGVFVGSQLRSDAGHWKTKSVNHKAVDLGWYLTSRTAK